MSQLPVEVGDVLAGKYRVDRVLGVGGMGVVVAAHHLQLDERVALKFLLEDTAARADLVARFVREARAGASLTQPSAIGPLRSRILFTPESADAIKLFLEGRRTNAAIGGEERLR